VGAALQRGENRACAGQPPQRRRRRRPRPSTPTPRWRRGDWERQGAVSCAAWLAWRIGLDRGAAREKVRVARALGHLQIFLHVDQDPLAADGVLAATLDDGTRVSAETLRRLACDSSLVPVLHSAQGKTIDVGRRTRTVSPALRRALWIRDRGCRFPACTNHLYLHGHHIAHWAHGGPTSADNLLLLCSRHHRLLHEGGFEVRRAANGDVVFLDWPTFTAPTSPPAISRRCGRRWAFRRCRRRPRRRGARG